MAIKNIIFDIGAVLKGWNTDLTNLYGEETGKAVEHAIWKSGYWNEMDRGVIEEAELFQKMISTAPEHKDKICWILDHLSYVSERYPYSIPWIKSLKEAGYHVYYLSNYSRWLRKQVPETLGFLPYMDGGVFSCDVKLLKPDIAIYQLICKKYHLIAEECLFIDDRQENVEGAIHAGMHSLCFVKEDISRPQIEEYLHEFGAPEKRAVRRILPDLLQSDRKSRILVYGDSNTYGWDPRSIFGEPYEEPWPALLKKKTSYEIISNGIPGREIPHTKIQIQWMLEEIHKYEHLDLLILMLGTNDILNSSNPVPGKIAERMDVLLSNLTGQAKTQILLLCPPRVHIGAEKYQKASIELATELKILADQYDIASADASEANPELAFDGIHLTEGGHRRLAAWLLGEMQDG